MGASVDVEAVLIAWLTTQLPSTTRVLTELPSTLETSVPIVQVERIGGVDRVLTLDAARVDVICYAATRALARALAIQVHDLLRMHLPGVGVAGGVVSRVATDGGVTWLPYDNPAIRRFGGTYQITAHTTK